MEISDGNNVSVCVDFNELGKDLQFKIYRASKEEMAKTASKSIYYELRMEVAKDSRSNELLTEMLLEELNNDDVKQVIFSILNNESFCLNDDIRMRLIESSCADVREYVAEEYDTPLEMLYKMLDNEIENHGDPNVISQIVYHENFVMNDFYREKLSKSLNWEVRIIVAKDYYTKRDLLRKMFYDEINKGYLEDYDVIYEIINNKNFDCKPSDMEVFARSQNEKKRILAAESQLSSFKTLLYMLYYELEKYNNKNVIEKILHNKVFKDALKEYIK